MASPVAHALLGVAVGEGTRGRDALQPVDRPSASRLRNGTPQRWLLPAVAAFAAVAPDLDFLPGIVLGDPNQFHQLQSHTLLAALLVGLAAGLATVPTRLSSLRVGVAVGLAYASHLLLDVFTRDLGAPFGIPLLWPLSSEHFILPWPLFRAIHHGLPGQDLGTALGELISVHNLAAVGIELVITLPIVLLVHLFSRRRRTVGEMDD